MARLSGNQNVRMAQIDIDALYIDIEDDDAERSEFKKNIEKMVTAVKRNGINIVALQTFCDDDSDGNVSEVYFNNTLIPVKDNVFNQVASAIKAEGIKVVGWLPGLCYTPLALADKSNLIATSSDEESWYQRVSPFCEDNLVKLETIYRELSKNTVCDGILFQDDLYMNDYEDASTWGKAAYKAEFGKDYEPPKDGGSETITPWAKFKTRKLTEVALRLAAAFKENRPDAIVMRDIYSSIILEPNSEEWFAQNFDDCVENFDYTVIMAYPYMDHEEPEPFFTNICNYIKSKDSSVNDKVIMKIQTVDWDTDKDMGQENFQWQINYISNQGIKNIGYYPHTESIWPQKTVIRRDSKMRSVAEMIKNIYNNLAALSNGLTSKLDIKGGTIKGDLVVEGSLTASNLSSSGSGNTDPSGDVAGEESFSAVKIRKLLDVTKWDKETHRQVVEDDKIKADSTILMSLPVGTADDVYSSFGAANIIARAQNDGSVTLEYTGTEPDQSYLVSMCIL